MMCTASVPEMHVCVGLVKVLSTCCGCSLRSIHTFMKGSVSVPEIHVFIGLVKILNTDQGYSIRYHHTFTMCSTSVRKMHVFVDLVDLVDQSYNSQLGQASTVVEVSKYIEIFAFICAVIQILHCSGVICTYRKRFTWIMLAA